MSEMRRDSFNMFNNDHLAVLFDTFHDRRNGFGFAANRLGGLFDWTATNEQPSPNWNGLWASAGHATSTAAGRSRCGSRSARSGSRTAATSGA